MMNPNLLKLFSCAFLSLASHLAIAQRPAVSVYLGTERIAFDRTQPLRVGRRVLVPMRNIFEKMGATVGYDVRRRSAVIRKGSKTIYVPLGRQYAWVNGRRWRLDQPSRVRNGRVLVPIRFVAEHLDAEVVYRRLENSIRITPH